MSFGQPLNFGCELSGGAMPFRRFIRPARFAHQRAYSEFAKSMPAWRIETSSPYCSSVRRNVISTYRSSLLYAMFRGMSLDQAGTLSAGITTSLNLNSVGMPHETPTICPTQPPFMRSRKSSSESRRSPACRTAAASAATAKIVLLKLM